MRSPISLLLTAASVDFCDTTEGVLGVFAGIANQQSNPCATPVLACRFDAAAASGLRAEVPPLLATRLVSCVLCRALRLATVTWSGSCRF